MGKKYKIVLGFILTFIAILFACFYLSQIDAAVLNPKGIIGLKEKQLFVVVSLLMLIVVVPTFFLTFWFAWKYREGNTKAKYTPDWEQNRTAEFIWWGIPCVIVLVIGILCWKGCRELDPFKPLSSNVKPLKVQVVALQWKWLFIYPEHKIATVNFFQFPKETPINFDITADAPMNSFWIPRLGGQIYAMPGMRSKLHLIADEEGQFRGSSANLSGSGFSDMTFVAKASSQGDFDQWIDSVKQSSRALSFEEYRHLAEPSERNGVATYLLTDENLYEQIVMKFMGPMEMENATRSN